VDPLDSSSKHFFDELDGELDTVLLDSGIIILDGFEIVPNRFRHMVVVEGDDTFETLVVLDGEDARDNRAGDANGTAFGDKVQEHIDVVEELRDDQIGASIYLGFQVFQVVFFGRVVNVSFRVAF
jgi:hypothetical protein